MRKLNKENARKEDTKVFNVNELRKAIKDLYSLPPENIFPVDNGVYIGEDLNRTFNLSNFPFTSAGAGYTSGNFNFTTAAAPSGSYNIGYDPYKVSSSDNDIDNEETKQGEFQL